MSIRFKKVAILVSTIVLMSSSFALGSGYGSYASTADNTNTTYNPNLGRLVDADKPLTRINKYSITELQSFLIESQICKGIPDSQKFRCTNIKSLINGDKKRFGVDGNIDEMVIKGASKLGISSVKAFQLKYTVSSVDGKGDNPSSQPQVVSGLVLVPQIAYTRKLKGILLYYHDSAFNKTRVPSINKEIQEKLAAIYATQGYIVIAPDYLGQGVNKQIVHPFTLYPRENAITGLYMLKAYKEFEQLNSLNLNTNKLFISSYSEGAPYALWASKLLQQTSFTQLLNDTQLDLKRTIGISGAYDLSGVTMDFEFNNTSNISADEDVNPYFTAPPVGDNVDSFGLPITQLIISMGKLSLMNYALVAYMNYTATQPASSYVNQDFFDMNQCGSIEAFASGKPRSVAPCAIRGKHYNLKQLFSTEDNLSEFSIQMQLFTSAYGVANYFTGEFTNILFLMQAMMDGYVNNSVATIVNKDMIYSNEVKDFIAKQNIYDWKTTSPITLIALERDSIVTNLNTKKACDAKTPSLFSNSAPGLVSCGGDLYLNNYSDNYITIFPINDLLGSSVFSNQIVPVYVDHLTAEPILQLMALHQIEKTN